MCDGRIDRLRYAPVAHGPEMDISRPFCQCACHWIDRSRSMRLTERFAAIDNVYSKHVGFNINDGTEWRDHDDCCGFC